MQCPCISTSTGSLSHTQVFLQLWTTSGVIFLPSPIWTATWKSLPLVTAHIMTMTRESWWQQVSTIMRMTQPSRAVVKMSLLTARVVPPSLPPSLPPYTHSYLPTGADRTAVIIAATVVPVILVLLLSIAACVVVLFLCWHARKSHSVQIGAPTETSTPPLEEDISFEDRKPLVM